MARVVSSNDHGVWLSPTNGTTVITGTYNFVAGPGTDEIIAVYDSLGTPPIGATVPYIVPYVRNLSGIGVGFDYTWVVRGCDVKPTPAIPPIPFVSADWTAISTQVQPQKRETQAFATMGTPQQEFLHIWRYYLVYISSTAVAPGGNVQFGFDFVKRG
jgi:hypothetical protein